jgi:hypothetical protein
MITLSFVFILSWVHKHLEAQLEDLQLPKHGHISQKAAID